MFCLCFVLEDKVDGDEEESGNEDEEEADDEEEAEQAQNTIMFDLKQCFFYGNW